MKTHHVLITLSAAASVLALGAWNTSASHNPASKIDDTVRLIQSRAAKKSAGISVLVILRDQADLSAAKSLETKADKGSFVYRALQDTATRSQRPLHDWLGARGIAYQSFFILNAIAIDEADETLLLEIAARDEVRRIIANPEIRTFMPQGHGIKERFAAGIAPNIESTGAPRVWSELNVNGKGIVVAGQDTGVDWDHPALISNYRGYRGRNVTPEHKYSWHDAIRSRISSGNNVCGLNSKEPCDDDQHGTHTMGSIVGTDGQGTITGMAPGAQWIACRNMDVGLGKPSTYIECFEYFLAPGGRPDLAPHVMNNSWGCPTSEGCQGREFGPVLEALEKAGVMVVVSAGNSGPGCKTINDQPATWTALTFSVGAMDHRSGTIASFSSRGPSRLDGGIGPDVAAPGVNVLSTVPGGGYEGSGWSGTSMSGPHVVGLVALLWSANDKLIGKIAETAEIIRKTATPKSAMQACGGVSGSQLPNNTYGYGNINAVQAVEMAKQYR